MTRISNTLDDKYAGCGAYLVAFSINDNVIDIMRTPSFPLLQAPTFPPKRGRLSKAEASTRAKAVAEAWRTLDAEIDAWAAALRNWRPAQAARIESLDMSCLEVVSRMSDLSWQAHDALRGSELLRSIHHNEGRARAFAAEART